MLTSDSCFVLDCKTDIFVWYGDDCKADGPARQASLSFAHNLKDEASCPWAQITKVRQRCESILFREKFEGDWGEFTDFDFSKTTTGNVAELVQKEINLLELHYPAEYAIANEGNDRKAIPPKQSSDNGELDFWLITGKDRSELPRQEYGHFFAGNCYLLIYRVQVGEDQKGNSLDRHVVYYWQGHHSSREDRGTSAVLAGDISQRLRFAVCSRIIQNKEPDHFLSHFTPSGMVVSKGTRPSSVARPSRVPTEGVHLFQIRGTNAINSHAVETKLSASSLNSHDSFVLIVNDAGKQSVSVWHGEGANEHVQSTARSLAELSLITLSIGPPVQEHKEGHETEKFWQLLGGRSAYSNFVHLHNSKNIRPRLFQCSNSIGIFRVVEITFDNVKLFQTGGVKNGDGYVSFAQDDLTDRDVLVLDGGHELWIWRGSNSNDACTQMAQDAFKKYLAFDDGTIKSREATCPIQTTTSGEEPVGFQSYFHAWDFELAAAAADTYGSKLKALQNSQKKN